MTDNELKELVASLAIAQTKTEKEINKLTEQIKETNRQLGGIGNSNGEFAENFFYSSLKITKQLGNIKFDNVDDRVKHRRKQLVDEFDIVMYNGNCIGLIEVKYTAKSAHIKQLTTTKTQNFRTLFPEYEGYKLYLGIAGLSFENDNVKIEAKEAGLAILEIQGNHLQTDTQSMRAY